MIAFKGTSVYMENDGDRDNQGDSEHVRAQKLLDDIPIDPF